MNFEGRERGSGRQLQGRRKRWGRFKTTTKTKKRLGGVVVSVGWCSCISSSSSSSWKLKVSNPEQALRPLLARNT
ncbi:hypothetical protein M0804_015626 [Polistes exclamans]|nr:hypothetical protein M0804_015627 [Polistes exclamans]KAI4472750.1 hypothetical protein M0804_015626 [Polistes exclamans]